MGHPRLRRSAPLFLLALSVVAWGVLTPGATVDTAFIPGRDPLIGVVAASVGFWTGHVYGETFDDLRWSLPGGITLTIAALTAGAGAAVPPVVGFPMGALSGGLFWPESSASR